MRRNPTIGAISSGTLRNEDLLIALEAELDYLAGDEPTDAERKLLDEAESVDPESEEADWIIDELIDALSDLAPAYVYFGAHEGDGACFGFWPDIDGLEDAARFNDGVVRIDAGDEIPWTDLDPETHYAMEVTDHGNVTLYALDHLGQSKSEIWACV